MLAMNKVQVSHLVVHAVHDGHQLLQSGLGKQVKNPGYISVFHLALLFTALGHEVLAEAGDHAHDLGEGAHLHHVGELLVPAHEGLEVMVEC